MQSRQHPLAVLSAIARSAAGSLDLGETLNASLDAALGALRFDAGAILLLDPDKQYLTVHVHRGYSEAFIATVRQLRIGEGVAGLAVQAGRPVTTDISHFPTPHLAPFFAKERIRTLAGTPLLAKGQVVGALSVTSRRRRTFKEPELDLLATIGVLLGGAVYNARLFQETERARDYLQKVLDSSPDPIFTFHRNGSFGYLNPQIQKLTGYTPESVRGKNVLQFIARPRRREAVRHWRALDRGEPGSFESEVTAADGHTIPVQVAQSPIAGSNEYLVILRDITKLKSAQEELHQRVQDLGILNRIASAVAGTLNLNELLEVVHAEVTAVLQADAFFIALYDPETDELDFRLRHDQGQRAAPTRRPLGAGLTAEVVRSKRPLLIRNLPEEKDRLASVVLWGSMALPASWLGVPIMLGEELVGVICVQSYRPNAYADEHCVLLSTLAAQTAAAIRNARLYEAQQRRARRLGGIVKLGADLAAIRDVDQLFSTLVTRTAELTGSPACTVLTVDQAAGHAVLAAHFGLPEGTATDLRVPLTLPPIRDAVQTAQPIIVHDIDRDQPDLRRLLIRRDVNAFFAFPLVRDGLVRGFITLSSLRPRAPSPEEIATYQLLAELAASAIENAQLYESSQARVRALSALAEVGKALNRALSLQEILDIVLAQAVSLGGRKQGAVILRDPQTDTLRIAAACGFAPDVIESFNARPVYAHEGTFGIVLTSGEMLEIADATTDPRVLRDVGAPPGQLTNVPLRSGREVLGLISLDAVPRDDESRSLLMALADLAGVAIQRAQLFESEQQRLRTLSLLNDLSVETSASLDLDVVLRAVVRGAVDAVRADAASINLLIQPGRARTMAAVGLCDRYLGITQVRPAGVTMKVITTGETVIIPDTRLQADLVNPAILEEGMRSFAALPLRGRSGIIGAMLVLFRQPHRFPAEEIRLLTTLANQASAAIENAKLFQQEQLRARQLAALNEVAKHAASTLHLDEILRAVTSSIQKGFGYHNVDAFLVEGDCAALKAIAGAYADLTPAGFCQPLTVGIIGWAITHDQTVVANDVSKDPHYVPGCHAESVTKSELCVPIHVDGKVIGALDVQSAELDAFTNWDVTTMETVADQVALACKNALTYSHLNEEKARLELLYEIAAEVNSSLDVDDILVRAVRRLTETLHGAVGYAFAVQPGTQALEMRARVVATSAVAETTTGHSLPPGEGLSGWVAATGQPALVDDVSQDQRWRSLDEADQAARSAVSVPLAQANEVLGVITVAHPTPNFFTPSHLRLMTAIAQEVSVAIANARLHEIARQQAELDSLTQVYNHGELIRRLALAVEQARTDGSQLAYIMLDIDGFKEYNDRHGHVTGDLVLRTIVEVIRANIMKTDIVGRWGGEEFGIVLPHTGTAQALTVSERIRATLASTPIRDGNGAATARPTVSQGISVFPELASSTEQLIDQADAALYRAKRKGRDQTVVWCL